MDAVEATCVAIAIMPLRNDPRSVHERCTKFELFDALGRLSQCRVHVSRCVTRRDRRDRKKATRAFKSVPLRLRVSFLIMALTALAPEILAMLPVDQASLASLACTCKALRAGVKEAWSYRHVRLDNSDVRALMHMHARSLCVERKKPRALGNFFDDSTPCPVPRASSSLVRLEMHGPRIDANADAFWTQVFTNAPALADVALHHPLVTYDLLRFERSVDACYALMRAGKDTLRRLELWCTGPSMPSTYLRQIAMHLKNGDRSVVMPELRTLVIKGRQLCPSMSIHAPNLVSIAIEESAVFILTTKPLKEDPPTFASLLSDSTMANVECLTWSLPVYCALDNLSRCTRLKRLDIEIRDIHTIAEFDAALEALRRVPPTLTDIRISLDFMSMVFETPEFKYDVDVLKHVTHLKRVSVTVSFPTPHFGKLARTLLGASPASVTYVSLRALMGPAAAHRDVREHIEYDNKENGGLDEDDDEVRDLDMIIRSLERNCRLTGADVGACLATFRNARLVLKGAVQ